MSHQQIDGFAAPEVVAGGDIALPVYCSLQGTHPLIVLHELPGMSPSFIAFCRRMAETGYKVYMPLMFGAPGMELKRLGSLRLCLRSEFRRLFYHRSEDGEGRPFTGWLLHLVSTVGSRHPEALIGVVGMCLTGGFALAALARPKVDAVIACQPAWPLFFSIATLGLSTAERNGAAARARTLPSSCAKGYRFADDRICRESHMRAAKAMLGDAFERYPDLPGSHHSTLTGGAASEAVFRDVLEFLDKRLRA
jgi:dienelactone hydrolase